MNSLLRDFKSIRSSLLLLVTATLLVYAVSFSNGFVLDDNVIIVKNPDTVHVGNVGKLLFSPDVIKPYYRPLNRASYLLDYQLFGMNPVWFHAVNIIIHLLNVVLLYLVGCRLLADRRAALIAALLFAVHPVNSEAVNFIAARNTLLALFFSLASLLVFYGVKDRGGRWPILAALLFFCGLLSKETGLMLIAIIGLYALFPGFLPDGEKFRVRMTSLVPFLVAAIVYFAMRAYSLHGMVGIKVPTDGMLDRLAANYHVIPQYLGLLLFPVDLTLFHTIQQGGLFTPFWHFPVFAAFLALVLLIVRHRNRAALFGLAWCAVNYLPISNIVPIPSDPITERFLYLPAVGAFIILGAGVSWLFAMEKTKRFVWLAAAGLAMACAVLTVRRNLEWKDEFSLFASGVRNNPASAEAHYNLGTAFQDRGDFVAARQEWETALKLDPANSDALIQVGTCFAMDGDLRMAQQYYDAALSAPPGKVDPGKAMAHYNLGKIFERWHRPDQARLQYESFLENVPLGYDEYIADAKGRLAGLGVAPYPAVRPKRQK